MAQKALPFYNTIQQKIQQSEVVGSDETGASCAGKKGWFHTWQTTALTFIAASMNRGYQTIEKYFPDGFPLSVYVSDCWAAQLKVVAFLHQLCIAHLLRELRNFQDALSCKWSIALIMKKVSSFTIRLPTESFSNPKASEVFAVQSLPSTRQAKVLAPVCVAGGIWQTGSVQMFCFLHLRVINEIVESSRNVQICFFIYTGS